MTRRATPGRPSLRRTGAYATSALLAVGLAVPLSAVRPAGAATTITVTTTADELNAGGACSLREAVRAANLDTAVGGCPAGNGADTIVVPAGTYRLTRVGAQEQQALLGDLDLRQSVTVKGAGVGKTVLDGNATERIFDVFGGTVVTISGVTLQDGQPAAGRRGGALVVLAGADVLLDKSVVRGNRTTDGPDAIPDGGGIYNDGTLRIRSSSVLGNTAASGEGSGGGIWNSGTLTLTTSTVSGNSAPSSDPVAHAIDGGGGIYSSGTLTLDRSTVSGNTSGYRGGGVASTGTTTVLRSTVSDDRGAVGGGLWTSGPMPVTASTITGNAATGDGGGLWSSAATTLASVTLSLSTADSDGNGTGDGGGVYVAAGRVLVRGSVFDANTDTGKQAPGCRVAGGSYTSQGFNHFGGTTGCVITGLKTTDQVGGSALLGPLADNGGPTQTRLPLAGSPVVDAGSPATPGSGGTSCATTDQRGTARPQDGDGNGTARCDMGAVELTP